MRTSAVLAAAALIAVFAGAGSCAHASRMRVPPGFAAAALAAGAGSDTLVLAPGVHPGPLRITRTVTLRGEPGAIVDGGGHGSAIEVAAPGTVIEDLAVRASGRRVITIDAGLRVLSAANVTVRRVQMRDVLYGIYAERAIGLVVEHCDLRGRVRPLDESGEGNGVHLWYCEGGRILGNTVEAFTDAVYLSFAHHANVEGNLLQRSGRYGLHTMYCQDNRLIGNRLTHNLAGCAIMFSNHLVAEDNTIVHNRGPRTYGLLLRDCSDGTFTRNRLVDNTIAIFMDGSNRNHLRENLVQDNGWGILLFSSSAGNEFTENAFINDDYPVALDMRRTDNRFDTGTRGNYWSENAPYDLDGDGVSDVPYSPVSAFAFLSKQNPDLSVLAKSPAVAALSVAERVFPALRPSEAVDHHPLVSPSLPRDRSGRGVARPAPVWGAFVGFLTLAGGGLAGFVSGRRS